MSAENEMPQYQSHKKVRAVKIVDITPDDDSLDKLLIWFRKSEDGDEDCVVVYNQWADKHVPKVGGYFVQYEDGYQSYSPAEAFESGYTLIES